MFHKNDLSHCPTPALASLISLPEKEKNLDCLIVNLDQSIKAAALASRGFSISRYSRPFIGGAG
jgi:hypothetical protein